MQQFFKCVVGEYKKRRRSTFTLLHVSLPFVLTGILVLYSLSRNVPLNATTSYVILFQLIGISTPVIISILCGMVADAESEAGHFQNILGLIPSKRLLYLSQIVMMILSYSVAILFTISIYIFALKFFVQVEEINIVLYYLTGMIFIATAIFQYFFFHYISYNHGVEISGIFGFIGLMIAALSLTTLGDKVWVFLPWAWANRFSEYLTHSLQLRDIVVFSDSIPVIGLLSFFILTGCIVLINIIWIGKWEGRKTIT